MRRATWQWVKLSLLIIGLAGVVALLSFFRIPWAQLTPTQLRTYALSFGWWAPFVYLLIFIQPVVPLPVSVLLLAGGLLFGVLWGTVMGLIAALLRGCGQFLIARTLGRGAVETLLRGRLGAWDARIGKHGFETVLWIRLLPNLPYDMQNFCFGLSQVSFRMFATATLLSLIPNVWLWVYLGHHLTGTGFWWKVCVVLVVPCALWYLLKRYRAHRAQSPETL